MPYESETLDHAQRRSGIVLLASVVILLLVLGGRLVYINTALSPRLLAIAAQQQEGKSRIPARRGMIFDTCGRVVALSRQIPDVFVDPTMVDDVDAFADAIAPRINLSAAEIVERMRKRPGSRYVVLAREVDAVTAEAVRDLANPAVGLTDRAKRSYPLGTSMAHALGWVGRDGHGMAGVELSFDQRLSGRDGRRSTVRDARRRALRRTEGATVPPVDGGHVVLTIDAEVQRITEQALADQIAKHEAQSGLALVMDPSNGEILAMASWPTFHPEESLEPGSAAIRRNRVVTDPVEPGSTFKPFIASSALDGGFVSLGEKIDCKNGRCRFPGRVIEDSKANGLQDVRGIITRSSNIGMAFIGQRMGNEVLYETVKRFGFGQRTELDCPGEGAGVVRPLPRWDKLSTTSIPFGYEILVTPIQLASAFSALVNDGVLLKPRLAKMTLTPDGKVIDRFDKPQIVRRVASSDVARLMTRDFLVSVVENGSTRKHRPDGYRMLGKTGTVKLLYPKGGSYEPGAYLSLFIAAAPVSDPKIVVLVMVRRPNTDKGYYGATVAAPAVGRILGEVLPYLQVPPEPKVALTGL